MQNLKEEEHTIQTRIDSFRAEYQRTGKSTGLQRLYYQSDLQRLQLVKIKITTLDEKQKWATKLNDEHEQATKKSTHTPETKEADETGDTTKKENEEGNRQGGEGQTERYDINKIFKV